MSNYLTTYISNLLCVLLPDGDTSEPVFCGLQTRGYIIQIYAKANEYFVPWSATGKIWPLYGFSSLSANVTTVRKKNVRHCVPYYNLIQNRHDPFVLRMSKIDNGHCGIHVD